MADHAENRADGYDIVDADHVAHGAAHGLRGQNYIMAEGREVQRVGDIPLEVAEQHVGDSAGTCDERAQAARVGSEIGPGVAREIGHKLGHGHGHGGQAVGIDAGTLEHGNQRHGRDESDGGSLHLLEGGGPCAAYLGRTHGMQTDGDD